MHFHPKGISIVEHFSSSPTDIMAPKRSTLKDTTEISTGEAVESTPMNLLVPSFLQKSINSFEMTSPPLSGGGR